MVSKNSTLPLGIQTFSFIFYNPTIITNNFDIKMTILISKWHTSFCFLQNTAHFTCERKHQNNCLFVFSTREMEFTIHCILLLSRIENIKHIRHKINIIPGTASYYIIVHNLLKIFNICWILVQYPLPKFCMCRVRVHTIWSIQIQINSTNTFETMFIKTFVQIKHRQHMKLYSRCISPGKCMEIHICILILPASTSIK